MAFTIRSLMHAPS